MNYFLAMSRGDVLMIVVWAIIVVAALIIEFETASLVSIWFAAGGVAGIATALLGLDPWLQIVIFVAVSTIFVIGTRPFVKKVSDNQTILTNADRLIGMTAVVTKNILIGEKGEVKAEFQKWPAVSREEKDFLIGEKVLIVEIVGNKMVVESIKEIELD